MNDAGLFEVMMRLAALQGSRLDPLELKTAIDNVVTSATDAKKSLPPLVLVQRVIKALHLSKPVLPRHVDPSMVPMLGFTSQHNWCVVRGQNGHGRWVIQYFDVLQDSFAEAELDSLSDLRAIRVNLNRTVDINNSKIFQIIWDEFSQSKRRLYEVAAATVLINVLVTVASFYSMQVYDRVIPNHAINTLVVLTLGVVMSNVFELLLKHARTELLDEVSINIDRGMVRKIFLRLLGVRLDQMPPSVGSLSSELRGYESIKVLLSTTTLFLLTDAPFGLLFVGLMWLIAGPYMAAIPVLFFLLVLGVNAYFQKSMQAAASRTTTAENRKIGLLVETIEAAETIKASAGGWRMLSRWISLNDTARTYQFAMKHISERSQHFLGFAQQMAYVAQIGVGAYEVTQGSYTVGGLIACSILSGRALAPAAMLPSLLMQWAQAKASLQGLERFWDLPDDHSGVTRPLMPDTILGDFKFEDARITYPGIPMALNVPTLSIRAGEKIGVIGPIGSGKTTLLRALSGMYKPLQGRVLIDGMDMAFISKPLLAEYIGYLQQDGRLISGTLRDNLLIGIADPGDSAILQAANKTGLIQVVRSHPQGLDLPISEGGVGLSGGQRQLVNLTRLVLREPSIWLLDEPTASMDQASEAHCMKMFETALGDEDTLVLVTHKPELLKLVNRLIVIANHQIVLDGEKNSVLAALQRADLLTPAQGPVQALEEGEHV